MKKLFTIILLALATGAIAQNNVCSDLISSYNTAVTNASQVDPVFAILHNSVSSMPFSASSNGNGNGNNPWQSQGFQKSGNGAQVGVSVRMPGNKGFINVSYYINSQQWVFQHVQGTFPNYCAKTVVADCNGAQELSNTCP